VKRQTAQRNEVFRLDWKLRLASWTADLLLLLTKVLPVNVPVSSLNEASEVDTHSG